MTQPGDAALFEQVHGPVLADALSITLRDLGLERGATVMVHAELLRFGRLPKHHLADRTSLPMAIIHLLRTVIGDEGTLLMPTLTTGSLRSGVFDPDHSASETGLLSECFRRMPGVERTLHATHSMAVQGPLVPLFRDPPAHPFGEGSSFHRLREQGGKLLFLGADFHWCTFIHHIETMARVPYRRAIPVRIRLKGPGGGRYLEAFRFERPDRYWPDFERLRARAAERGTLRETRIGQAYVAVADAEALFREGMALLREDPLALVAVQPWPRYIAIKWRRLLRRINDRLSGALRPLR